MDINPEVITNELSELFIAINKGEYTFPEFGELKSKAKRKEYSLKAHSVLQRMFNLWMQKAGTAHENDS